MKQYAYTAKDASGAQVQGKLEASDRSSAVRILKERKLFILSLDEKKPSRSLKEQFMERLGNRICRVKPEDVMIFTRELATMINAGFPLVASIEILKEDLKSGALDDVLSDICAKVKSGCSFSESLEEHRGVFSNLYTNLVKAGEASGEIDRILENLAIYLENTEKIKRKIRGALFYPAILIGATLVILGIFFLFAIPKFKEIYISLDTPLPLPTIFFLNLSEFLEKYILIHVTILILSYYGIKHYLGTEKGKIYWDEKKLRIPIFKELFLKEAISRFARTLALLYTSGVPLIESMSLVSNVVDNVTIQKTITGAALSIQEGVSISVPLKESGVFPSIAVHMIDVGEKSGTLDKMLYKIADLYDLHIETWLSSLTAMLEPLLVIFLGFVIGFIVIVMALPIMKLPTVLH